MTAVRAAGTGETVGKDAAFEVTAEFAFGQCQGVAATAAVVERQLGGEVRLDDTLENRTFGLAPVVTAGELHDLVAVADMGIRIGGVKGCMSGQLIRLYGSLTTV